MTDAISARHLPTAKEFLSAISLQDSFWGSGDHLRWGFRGQGNDWPLIPSVLRVDPQTKLTPWEKRAGRITPGTASERSTEKYGLDRLTGEVMIVFDFRDAADHAGLTILEDSTRWRNWRNLAEITGLDQWVGPGDTEGAMMWPPDDLVTMVGLAQHFGIPTRLLDWSWNPKVSAYFACRDVMAAQRRKEPLTGNIVFWALNAFELPLHYQDFSVRPAIEVLRAPRASNQNLAAQAGFFTVTRGVHEGVAFDNVVASECKKNTAMRRDKLLRKLTMSVEHARDLMRVLALEQISAATVFPGFAGVVEGISERRWFTGT